MDYYNNIQFTTIGRQISKFYHVDFRSESYGIAFTRRGRMRFKKNKNPEKIIEAPLVYWYSPENKYTHGCFPGEDRDHSWCFCIGDRIRLITSSVLDQLFPEGCAPINKPVEMIRLFDTMIKIFGQKNPQQHFKIVIALEQVVGLIVESYIAGQKASEPELYQKIKSLANDIKDSPFRKWNFHDLIHYGIQFSYSYFRQLFTRIMGMPPNEYLLLCKMGDAAEMLVENKFLIREIAESCGYDNPAAFSRVFKKKIGLSPTGYITHLPIKQDTN